jgi:UPF0176 protein
MSKFSYIVLSLYKFFEIKNIFNFKNNVAKIFSGIDVKGIILIAPEGININISVKESEYEIIEKKLKKFFNYQDEDIKTSKVKKHIFRKFKIKIKKEILTTRNVKDINPLNRVGKYIEADEWNNFISDPNTLLIDMRNSYEVEVGTFNKAINPKCKNFTDLLNWLENDLINIKNLDNKKIAMFCTGGIRCEKATSFLLNLGKKNVYHLKGGILKYLEKQNNNSNNKNLWKGECFVFDNRVSLNANLKKGSYSLCHACRMPLTNADKKREEYIEGEACHLCYSIKTEEQRRRYRMRNNQIKLSN